MSQRLAITALDVLLADGSGIDSFDCGIYNGSLVSGEVLDDCLDQVIALADAIAVQVNTVTDELDLILYSSAINSDTELALLRKKLASVQQVESLTAAIETAQSITMHEPSRQVLVVAVSDGAKVDTVTAPQLHTLAFDHEMQNYRRSYGAGAVLFKAADTATAFGDKVYAFIDSMAVDSDIVNACQKSLKMADIGVADINYLEASASDNSDAQLEELDSLLTQYLKRDELSCGLGSARSVTGECGEFSAIAGLIKVALCLYSRYIPGNPGWTQPKNLPAWQDTAFYVPEQSRTWYLNTGQSCRVAAYSLQESNNYSHMVLSENIEDHSRPNGYLAQLDLVCLPLLANNEAELVTMLDELSGKLTAGTALNEIKAEAYRNYQASTEARYAMVLLGESREELARELHLAKAGVAQVFKEKGEWKTPKGSYFTATPLGRDGKIAFVYPGVGAAYVGLGRDLYRLFPDTFYETRNMARNVGSTLKDRIINPRSVTKLNLKDIKERDLELRRNLATISECGVAYAYVLTKIFNNAIGVDADLAFGYSMGEVSMHAALDHWKDPGALSARLAASPTFNHNLTGEMRTLRKHWDLPLVPQQGEEQLWETYTLKGSVEEVAEACSKEDRVYLTIINTPDQMVIGGDPKACQRVIDDLGVRGMAMEIPSAIHSAPAFKEYENMEKLYTLDVGEKVETEMYSSSCYLPVPQRTKSIANSIAKCFCEQVDFPRLVNTVYEKGARIFIEMGAGRSCCSWIDKILKHEGDNKPHVSIPANAKGTPDHITIARAMAKLVSHRVDVNLHAFFEGSLLPRQNHADVKEGAA